MDSGNSAPDGAVPDAEHHFHAAMLPAGLNPSLIASIGELAEASGTDPASFSQDIKRERQKLRRRDGEGDIEVASQDTIESARSDNSHGYEISEAARPLQASIPAGAAVAALATHHAGSTTPWRGLELHASPLSVSVGSTEAPSDAISTSVCTLPALKAFSIRVLSSSGLRLVPIQHDGGSFFSAAAFLMYGEASRWRQVRDSLGAFMQGDLAPEPVSRGRIRAHFSALIRATLPPGSAGPSRAIDSSTPVLHAYVADLERGCVNIAPGIAALALLTGRHVRVFRVDTPPASASAADCVHRYEGPHLDAVASHFSPLNLTLQEWRARDGTARVQHWDVLMPAAEMAVLREYASMDAAFDDTAFDEVGDDEDEEGSERSGDSGGKEGAVHREMGDKGAAASLAHPADVKYQRCIYSLPELWSPAASSTEDLDEAESGDSFPFAAAKADLIEGECSSSGTAQGGAHADSAPALSSTWFRLHIRTLPPLRTATSASIELANQLAR